MTENKNEKLGWINGHWGVFKDLKVPINDRGLNFADGIFETIFILNGVPQLLNEHLNRWEKSASILEMNPPPSKEWLISLVEDGINRSQLNNVNGVIRINWTRGPSKQRGIDISKTSLHSFWLEIDSFQPNFESISTKNVFNTILFFFTSKLEILTILYVGIVICLLVSAPLQDPSPPAASSTNPIRAMASRSSSENHALPEIWALLIRTVNPSLPLGPSRSITHSNPPST